LEGGIETGRGTCRDRMPPDEWYCTEAPKLEHQDLLKHQEFLRLQQDSYA